MTQSPTGRIALAGAALAAFLVLLGPGAAHADAEVMAGAAKVDASWHVGASAGQYAGDCATDNAEDAQSAFEEQDPTILTDGVQQNTCAFGVDAADGTFDPSGHSVRRKKSYGLQSRLDVRAIVVKGATGAPVAVVKTNQYIPQDLLYRRAAQLLEASSEDCGVTRATLTMASTHNHSSPMYSSTAWGVWAFQDVFDIRFYNYLAAKIADAVTEACDELAPARVGASVGYFDKTHRHSFGPSLANDGTPAGYPNAETDHDMTVIRFDNSATGEPIANLVNFSLHPEFLEGNNLLSADYIAPLERITDRATEAITIFTQGAVGTAEPERSTYHPISERLEFTHKDYAQAEYGASLMSEKLVGIWNDIEDGTPEDPDRFVPFSGDFPVMMSDNWYPEPLSHPYPGVSNCRSDNAIGGDPQIPLAGLPDCQSAEGGLRNVTDQVPGYSDTVNNPETDPGLDTDDFQQAGIPVPENYSAPSYTGLQEDLNIHLQGIRLGEIYLPICSCEQWFDQSKNIETRTDKIAGNEWLGYDWGAQCTPNNNGTYFEFGTPGENGTGTWSCPNPGNTSQMLPPISDHKYRRMRAQVLNPADGWNEPGNLLQAESEPFDTTQIKGNYTHDDVDPEDSSLADDGYTLTVPISMANDYNGYIATYREYQRGDHYRKALTGWGPHSSDYMSSRLVTIGRELNGSDAELPADQQLEEMVLQPKVDADIAVNDARAEALGRVGTAAVDAYEAALPDDGGDPAEVAAADQPKDVERFETAFFTWKGGSNYTDDPQVSVERKVDGQWEQYADQSGEIPVTLQFPQVENGPAYLTGGQEWRWTAHFEAFVAPFDVGSEEATPAGEYRFVVDGVQRKGGAEAPYSVTSDVFDVKPWDGITVEGLQEDADGRVSLTAANEDSAFDSDGAVGPIDYPDSYDDPRKAKFVRWSRTVSGGEHFCFTCSFRPWLDSDEADSVQMIFFDGAGNREVVDATQVDGRWVSERPLAEGESAYVPSGCVKDGYGNMNGTGTTAVGASTDVPAGDLGCAATPPPDPDPDPDPDPTTDPPPAGSEPVPAETPPAGDGGTEGSPLPAPGPSPAACQRGTRRDDKLNGTAGDDCLAGGRGNDRLKGAAGNDRIIGGPGDDRLSGGPGADTIDCGPGDDVVRADGDDRLRGCETVRGAS